MASVKEMIRAKLNEKSNAKMSVSIAKMSEDERRWGEMKDKADDEG